MLVVTDEAACRVGGERRLPCPGKPEEERDVTLVAFVGRAVHDEDAELGQRVREISCSTRPRHSIPPRPNPSRTSNSTSPCPTTSTTDPSELVPAPQVLAPRPAHSAYLSIRPAQRSMPRFPALAPPKSGPPGAPETYPLLLCLPRHPRHTLHAVGRPRLDSLLWGWRPRRTLLTRRRLRFWPPASAFVEMPDRFLSAGTSGGGNAVFVTRARYCFTVCGWCDPSKLSQP